MRMHPHNKDDILYKTASTDAIRLLHAKNKDSKENNR